jgi:NAD+ kinase
MTKKNVFQRVILYARQQRENQDVIETLQQLITYLGQRQHDVYFDQDTALCCTLDIPVLPREDMNPAHDMIIVVGGDGSLLSAARVATLKHIPVIGINRGHLGFLTDISPQEFAKQLDAVLEGQYSSESRSLLAMTIQDQHPPLSEGIALNDVVLSRGNETRLISFDVYIDEQFVSHYRADGLILATPTGSTAYALSAGGPILHPQLDAMVMVPMFSHSLSARPLVIAGQSQVVLHITSDNDMPLQISCDGHDAYAIAPGQRVTIQQHTTPLQLLHPKDYHYYDTLRIKLGWGSKG